MQTVDFYTIVENGMIEIPAEFRDRIRGRVLVILRTEETEKTVPNLIDELLERPLLMDDFAPLPRLELYSQSRLGHRL